MLGVWRAPVSGERGHRRLDWAFEQEGCDTSAKFLLICMARLGNRDGTCFMSVARLAKMMRASVKTVQRCIKRLIRAGLIYDISSTKRGRQTRTYAFGCDGPMTPTTVGQNDADQGDKKSLRKGQIDGQNLLNHKKGIEPSAETATAFRSHRHGEARPIGAVLPARFVVPAGFPDGGEAQ